jgi:hypothetical protein
LSIQLKIAGRLGLFESAVVTVKGVKERFQVTYPTAKSDLKKLQALGILQEIEHPVAGLITYYCGPIYNIIFEGTAV